MTQHRWLVLVVTLTLACGSTLAQGPAPQIDIAPDFQVVSPSSDGVANTETPTIRWSPLTGASYYDVSVYADPDLLALIESARVMGTTEFPMTAQLIAGRAYYVRVSAGVGTRTETAAISRFRVLPVPAWMPEVELAVADGGRSHRGYRMLNFINLPTAVPAPRTPLLVLVNAHGEIVWWFRNHLPGYFLGPNVLPNGNLLVAGHLDGINGWVYGAAFEMTWTGFVVWHSSNEHMIHHDIAVGPGGHYIALHWIWEEHGGATLEGDGIALLDNRTGEALWEWNIFDHFDPAQYPTAEMRSPGISRRLHGDWTHSNAVVWDADRGMFWLSVRHFDSLIGIDYPSGNVRAIVGALGAGGPSLMSHQHAPEVQPDGKILLFDNGTRTLRSRATLIDFDEGTNTASEVWSWGDNFYDFFIGDADMLPNGNVLVTAGASRRIIEVEPSTGDIVWELRSRLPQWVIYRTIQVPAERIPAWVFPF